MQAESSRLDRNGDPEGAWRLLAWSNRESEGLGGARQTHTGWGLSADEQLTRTLTGFAARGRETSVEFFYRLSIAEGFHVGPSVQWIRRPGGEPGAATARVIGLRATLGF